MNIDVGGDSKNIRLARIESLNSLYLVILMKPQKQEHNPCDDIFLIRLKQISDNSL